MTAPTRVYFDTNPLIAAGWPRPSPQLQQVTALACTLGIPLCLPELVRYELEAAWVRRCLEEWNSARAALGRLRPKLHSAIALPDMPNPPTRKLLLKKIRADTKLFNEAFEPVPITARPIDEYLDGALWRVPPFDEKGRGFRDAVILDSIAADMNSRPESRGIFVTEDHDFDLKRAKIALPEGVLTIVKTLDELNTWIDEQLDTRIRADLAAQEEALRSLVTAKLHIFAEFLTVNLVLTAGDLGLFTPIQSVDGFRIARVGDIHFDRVDGEREGNRMSVDLVLDVSVRHNEMIQPPEKRFKIGAEVPQPPMTLEQALGLPVPVPATTQRQVTVTVDADVSGSDQNSRIRPLSVRTKRSFDGGLLGLMSEQRSDSA